MLVPGANVDGIAIALNHRLLTRKIGKGPRPITFKHEVPVVVFTEQGVQGQKRDEALVPIGVDAPHIEVGGGGGPAQTFLSEGLEDPIQENKPRKIGHVVICLDNSSSMAEPSGLKDNSSKLAHIQSVIHELIENGIPKDTACTLIVYSDWANVPINSQGKPLAFTTDLKALFDAIRDIKPCAGTNFPGALNLTKRKIKDTYSTLGINTNESPPLFIFITDGRIDGNAGYYGGKERIFPIAKEIRDLNAHSILIGTGERYDEQFLRELTGELGPSMMVHTPHPNPTINVFSMFVPTFANDIRNEHYMSTFARGFFMPGKFFDMMPSIKNTPFERVGTKDEKGPFYKIWTGYQKESICVGFVHKGNLESARLELCLQNHASGNIEHRVDIPIINFDDAAPYFEYKEQAEDALARLLSFLSQREWDPDAFNQVVKDFPKSFTQGEIASISQNLSRGDQASRQSNDARGSVDDASISFTTRSRADYRSSIIGNEQVNQFSIVPGDDAPSISSQSPGSSDRQVNDDIHLHSGIPGSLDAPVREDFHTINGPQDVNAAAYGKPQKSGLNLICIRGNLPNCNLNPTKQPSINIGRAEDCDFIISIPRVSRLQCKVHYENGRYYLADHGSTNGTFLNNKRVTSPEEIKNGDVIKLPGEIEFRVEIG